MYSIVDLMSDACVEELSEPPEQAASRNNVPNISVFISRIIPKPFPSRLPNRSDGRRELADKDDLIR